MNNILVTGGAGFIGSNFIKLLLKRRPDVKIVNVDLLTYAGNLENLREVEDRANYVFLKADIRERKRMAEVFAEHDIDAVVNFAARGQEHCGSRGIPDHQHIGRPGAT
jgi:dTDP-glucose 4,6-dehydratase